MRKEVVAILLVVVLICTGIYSGLAAGTEAQSWEIEEGVRMPGRYCDADVVRLPDGRYRMYYSLEPEVPDFEGQVYSAISSDGLIWVDESGVRIDRVAFPCVIQLPDGRWRMYYQDWKRPQDVKACIGSAVSHDGLTYEREEGVRLTTGESGSRDDYNIGAPTIVTLEDGRYRMYYRGSVYNESSPWGNEYTCILSAVSEDGLAWSKELGIRIDGRQPPFEGWVDGPYAVKRNGTFRLYFFAAGGPEVDGIYVAESHDGIAFDEPSRVLWGGMHPSDPCVIETPDGWRMYFGVHTQGIFSAIRLPSAPSPTPTPTPTPTPDSLGLENPRFGFVGADQDFAGIAELGIGWDRPHPGPFSWNTIEGEPGKYDFTLADRYVREAQRHGFRILATIWPFADWDQMICHSDLPETRFFTPPLATRRGKPCDMDAYRRFVEATVERYDGDGVDDMPGLRYGIRHWEVSNEPAMQEQPLIFFQGTPRDYFEVLKTTYEAVKETNPGSKVLHAGVAGVSGAFLDFWQAVFDLGGGRYFDIANIHSIDGALDLNAEDFGRFLKDNGIEATFWITEVQIGTSAGTSMKPWSDEEQAEMLVKGHVMAFEIGADKAFYTFYRAHLHQDPTMRAACLITEEGAKRPSYFALKTLVEKIGNFSSVEKLAEGQYRFVVDGKLIYALWGTGSIPAQISGTITVTDIRGDRQVMDSSSLILTDRPIFVELGEVMEEEPTPSPTPTPTPSPTPTPTPTAPTPTPTPSPTPAPTPAPTPSSAPSPSPTPPPAKERAPAAVADVALIGVAVVVVCCVIVGAIWLKRRR